MVVLVALSVAPACYQMDVRPTKLAARQNETECRAFLDGELAHRGYRPVPPIHAIPPYATHGFYVSTYRGHNPVPRIVGAYAMYTKDALVTNSSPLTHEIPGPTGSLIGLRVAARPDQGCDAELMATTYDCNASSVQCEVSPGASPDVDADIERIAVTFRSRLKL